MSKHVEITPTNLFARIESLKKWQIEQQQRLLEQQAQQTNFLSNEQRRMQEAFDVKQLENNNSVVRLEITDGTEDFSRISDEETEIKIIDIDELPIKSPTKDFNLLLEEKLNRSQSPVMEQDVRPKRPFLKKGTGLSRFRMTLKDVPNKSPQTNSNRKEKSIPTNSVRKRNTKPDKPPKTNSKDKVEYVEPIAPWRPAQQQQQQQVSNYNTLLAELCNARQQDPALFDTPVINKSSEINQQLFERELMDELKLFEALEQKVSNSSFCSTSSLVTRLMEHSTKSTPQKRNSFSSLQSKQQQSNNEAVQTSPKRNVYFAETPYCVSTTIEEETTDQSDCETSTNSNSSVNSDDVSDHPPKKPVFLKHRNRYHQQTIHKDASTNTDVEPVNTELLKLRLEELENEIETFRSENARVNKLKNQYENDSRVLEKQKNQLKKEVEEERQQMKQQLNEEKTKLMKDKQIYDKYMREIKDGKSLRQKDREELSVLRSQLTSVQEELKLKESKWGATHARLRNQVRHLEKENTSLRIENGELLTKNGKLEATNKQLLSRRPSETKVLHEINKNLTKLTQENKPGKIMKSKSESAIKKTENKTRNSSGSTKKHRHSDENNQNSLNTSSESNKCSTTQSFESIEQEYEKMFGKSSYDNENTVIPAPEVSSCSDTSSRREEIILEDGSLQITYPNGNVRTVSANGKTIVMKYHNGDVKETSKESGTIRYLYSDSRTWHTTYPDGLELLEFANGQIEKRFADGSSEILFPNGSRRCTTPNGSEEVAFPDGTILLTQSQTGEKILTLPNGQKEIHTTDHKRREYPDGTVKLVYPDGIQETRYANGRIRLKDKDGNLIMDSANV